MPDSSATFLPIPPPPHSLAALEAVVGGYQAAIVAHAAYVAANARAGIVSEMLEINLATQALWRLVAIRKALRDLMTSPAAPAPPPVNSPSPQCPRCPHEPSHPCPQSAPIAPGATPDSSHLSDTSHRSHLADPRDASGSSSASAARAVCPSPSSAAAAAPAVPARPHSHLNWPPPTRFFACHLDRKTWFDPLAPDPAAFDSDDPTDPHAPRAANPRPATILAGRFGGPDPNGPPLPPLPYAVKTQHIYYPSTPLLNEIHDAWHYDARPFLYPVEYIHETAAGRPISRPVPDPTAPAAALASFLDFDPSLDDLSAFPIPSIPATPSVPAVPTVPAFRLPGLWPSPAFNPPAPVPPDDLPSPPADSPPPPSPDSTTGQPPGPSTPASTPQDHDPPDAESLNPRPIPGRGG